MTQVKNNFKRWAEATAIRTIKTIAECALGFIVGATTFGEVNWLHCAEACAIAGIVCVATCLAGLPEVEE